MLLALLTSLSIAAAAPEPVVGAAHHGAVAGEELTWQSTITTSALTRSLRFAQPLPLDARIGDSIPQALPVRDTAGGPIVGVDLWQPSRVVLLTVVEDAPPEGAGTLHAPLLETDAIQRVTLEG